METRTILNVTINAHNKRENKLLNVIENYISQCIDCDKRQLYYTRDWYLQEINGMFTALYMLGCIKEPTPSFVFNDLINLYIPFN